MQFSIISSRISEWQPQADAQEVRRLLPEPLPLRRLSDDRTIVVDRPDNSGGLFVVQIEPLSRAGVERFARARGIPTLDFLGALDANYAWEFVRRPVDVVDLASYWLQHNRLGSFTELIEYDINCKLRPSQRDKGDPLSEQQVRAGAEALGAATVFCRQFAFKVPDETFAVTGVLDAPSCLPENWRKEQWQALLTRRVCQT